MEIVIKIPAAIGKVNEWNENININDKNIDEIIKIATKKIKEEFQHKNFIVEGELQLNIISIDEVEVFEVDRNGEFYKIKEIEM